jgi:CRP-like cAMP-binding protein
MRGDSNGHGGWVPEYIIEIDGAEYAWNHRTITVPVLRELARIPPDVPLLEIDAENRERRLEEDEVVVRPGAVRFASTRKPLSAGGRVQLQEHWLFAGIDPEELKPLLESAQEVRFLPGDLVFREEDKPDGLYLVTGGAVRVAARGEDGETVLVTASAGDIVGEMGVLDGQPRSGTARAVGICAAQFIPESPLLDLLERSPLVCMRMLAFLSRRMRQTNRRLAELPASAEPTPNPL